MRIPRESISGLVLAGGRGSRMGGADKGLQLWQGLPLVEHVLGRLSPQVGPVMVNANRNLAAYAALGMPVWPDTLPDHPGPLAGFIAGLAHCETPFMVTAPCDAPRLPLDLVDRLAAALLRDGADLAIAVTAEGQGLRAQPVFCLLRTTLLESLVAFTQSGQRKVERWTAQHRCANAVFDDPASFFNANTLDDLQGPAA